MCGIILLKKWSEKFPRLFALKKVFHTQIHSLLLRSICLFLVLKRKIFIIRKNASDSSSFHHLDKLLITESSFRKEKREINKRHTSGLRASRKWLSGVCERVIGENFRGWKLTGILRQALWFWFIDYVAGLIWKSDLTHNYLRSH